MSETFTIRYNVHSGLDANTQHDFEAKRLKAFMATYQNKVVNKVTSIKKLGVLIANPRAVEEKKAEPITTEYDVYEMVVEVE